MNADEFVTALAALAPAATELSRSGLSTVEAERFRTGYFCRRISFQPESDSLLDLCRNFDVSSLEVSVITLHSPSQFDAAHWAVGCLETDTIVYRMADGALRVREYEHPEREVCACARTGESFLRALLTVARLSTDRVRLGEGRQLEMSGRHALEECLSVAGEEAEPFYREVLGVW